MKRLLEEINSYLSKSNLKEAIAFLKDYSIDKGNDLSLLLFRFQDNESRNIKGVISNEEYVLTRNQIADSIQKIAQIIEEENLYLNKKITFEEAKIETIRKKVNSFLKPSVTSNWILFFQKIGWQFSIRTSTAFEKLKLPDVLLLGRYDKIRVRFEGITYLHDLEPNWESLNKYIRPSITQTSISNYLIFGIQPMPHDFGLCLLGWAYNFEISAWDEIILSKGSIINQRGVNFNLLGIENPNFSDKWNDVVQIWIECQKIQYDS